MKPRTKERIGWAAAFLLLGFIAGVSILLPGLMSRRDPAKDAELRAEGERAAWLAWIDAREIERGYHLCPPENPASPSLVILVMENESDLRPRIKTCLRIPSTLECATQHQYSALDTPGNHPMA
jgi:hypothetical protein